jgi:1-acyl-sn-glycerol-3-phosphate acyltransferase
VLTAPRVRDGLYRYWRGVARFILGTFWSVSCRGLKNVPPAGPCLIVANHASWRDIPLLAVCVARPLHFVALGGLLNPVRLRPLIRSYLERYTPIPQGVIRFLSPRLARFLPPRLAALGAIPLTSGHGFVRRIRTVLEDGGAVVIFAQGGIRRGVAKGSFRPGVGWIACRAASSGLDLSVVPVALMGTDKAGLRARLELRAGPPLRARPCTGRAHCVRFSRMLEARVAQIMQQHS